MCRTGSPCIAPLPPRGNQESKRIGWLAAAYTAASGCRETFGGSGTQCSSQRSRCVGPWGLPGAPLLTGLPPRSSRHWRRSAPTVRKGRAASARGAFLALPCSLGFRLAPPATGGARLCPHGGFHRIWRRKVNCPEGTREGPLGVYGKSAKSLA